MIRLFAALALPDEIAEGLIRRQHGLQGARWRPPEAFHITLRFFGDVREDLAADLDTELSTITGEPLTLELASVGAFGEAEHIHAVWAGVEDNPALRHLARSCETAARRAGLAADTRTYKPHVTLAYLRRPEPDRVAWWIQGNNLLHSPAFKVASFGLYSSWPAEEGSRYRLERSYPLG